MAEIETALGLGTEKPAEVGHYHKTESVLSSNDEKGSPSYEHDSEHRGDKRAPETEELGDAYNPNGYVGALALNPTLHQSESLDI